MSRARDNADLGDSYGVLGAGVTGGSGLTALGTVTAANFEHTDIVYPAGHILQTKTHNTTAGNGATTSETVNWTATSNNWVAHDTTGPDHSLGSIVTKAANSTIMAHATITPYWFWSTVVGQQGTIYNYFRISTVNTFASDLSSQLAGGSYQDCRSGAWWSGVLSYGQTHKQIGGRTQGGCVAIPTTYAKGTLVFYNQQVIHQYCDIAGIMSTLTVFEVQT